MGLVLRNRDARANTNRVGPLVRQLAKAVGAEGSGAELLLDVAIDGIRCVLTREVAGDGVTLSPREQEIVRLVAEGHPNKIIAAELEISTWTVGTHLRRIFAKLGVGSRAAMVARTAAPRLRAG